MNCCKISSDILDFSKNLLYNKKKNRNSAKNYGREETVDMKRLQRMVTVLMVLLLALTACDKRTTVNLAELETTSVAETEEETAEAQEIEAPTTIPVTEETAPATEVPAQPMEASVQLTEVPPETTEVPAAGEKTETVYILNINSKKIHYPTCESVQKMKPSNKKEYTGTMEDLLKQGYVPCKMCKPE